MYNSPTSLNNLNVSEYDLFQLAKEVRDITNNETAYKLFERNFRKFLKNPTGLINLLLGNSGYLTTIAVETNNFIAFKQLSIVGKYLSNEMNDIRAGFLPEPSNVTPTVYTKTINTNISIWDNDTIERRQRNQNRITIVNTFRMVGLIGMYEQSAIDNYTTTDDIEQRKKTLERYYNALVENDSSVYVIEDIKNALDTLKTKTEQVLMTKEQSGGVFKVTTIKLERPYSARQISYDLYGEYIQNEKIWDNFTNIIARLNRQQPAHALNGTIKILEVR